MTEFPHGIESNEKD